MSISGTPQATGLRYAGAPRCRIYNNAAQSIPDAVLTVVTFNTERWDTHNMWDAVAPTRITITLEGPYVVRFRGRLASAADYQQIYCDLRVDGSAIIAADDGLNTAKALAPAFGVDTDWYFTVGQYVEARVYHDNTANAARNLESVASYSPEFSVVRIGG